MTLSIGIIGGGYVGSATALFGCDKVQVFIWDSDPKRRIPRDCQPNDIIACDLIFICVPTPCSEDGSCNVSIVESVLKEFRSLSPEPLDVVIRSTVPPFTSKRLGTAFMPEFLTEKNWREDVRTRSDWIVGVPQNEHGRRIQKKIETLLQYSAEAGKIAGSNTNVVLPEEAELAKYVRNCFLSTKVAFFNEIYRLCERTQVNYEKIRELTGHDPRIGTSHMQVPGHDGLFGFGGTCFPKDLSALRAVYREFQVDSPVMDAVHRRNLDDRKE